MSDQPPGAITEQLRALHGGSPVALADLAALVYDHLHRLAAGQMSGERRAHTLPPTALVNEAFIRLRSGLPPEIASRAQFFAFCARIMRSILVDHARSRSTEKRGGGAILPLTRPGVARAPEPPLAPESIMDVHNAIESLEAKDPHLARLIELRFFAGMTAEETADALGLSVHAVRHDLRLAQAWLKKGLSR